MANSGCPRAGLAIGVLAGPAEIGILVMPTVQYSPAMYRLAAAMVGPDEAADMVQEAFVSAWRELPRLSDPDRWESWLRNMSGRMLILVIQPSALAGRRTI